MSHDLWLSLIQRESRFATEPVVVRNFDAFFTIVSRQTESDGIYFKSTYKMHDLARMNWDSGEARLPETCLLVMAT